jgi:hypothetical protein
MNTSDLVERIAAEHGVSKESTRTVIDLCSPRSPARRVPVMR